MPVEIIQGLPNENAAQIKGYCDDVQIRYNPFFQVPYGNFNDANTNPLYQFYYPTLQPIPGAMSVFSNLPSNPGYSPLWQVNAVIVPVGISPNEAGAITINKIPLTSEEAIKTSGLQILSQDYYINAPLVSPRSLNGSGRPLLKGWFKDKRLFYFSYEEFGRLPGGSAAPGDQQKPGTLPLYTFILPDNLPVLGAVNIFSAAPNSPGYSPIWTVRGVRVPEGAVANKDGSVSLSGIRLTSERAIKASNLPILTSAPGLPRYLDCPIVEISGTIVSFP